MLVEGILPTAHKRLVTIGEDAPVIEAAKLLRETNVNLVIVCNHDGAMVGVITKTDFVRQISHCQGSSCATAVSTMMTRGVTSCRPGDLLHAVWSVMKQHGLTHIPVVGQDTRPVGILNARNVVEALLGEVQNEESLLRDYVMGIGYQ